MRLLLIALTVVAASWSSAAPAFAQAPTVNVTNPTAGRWAVLVGIDDYTNVRDLNYCVADQRALQQTLVRAGFDVQHVTLLSDDANDKQLLPLRSNVEQQIERVCDLAKKGDLVLISFSGHGVHVGQTSYLCPADTRLDDPKTMIAVDWVYERLQKSPADLRIVVMDACRNVSPDPGNPPGSGASELKEASRDFVRASERLPEGLVLFSSCTGGELAQEDKGLGHSVFMHFLLDGLAGKADDNKNGRISLGELTRYASVETSLYVNKRFAETQRPKLKGKLTPQLLEFELGSSAALAEQLTNSLGMKLTLILPGEFLMGNNELLETVVELASQAGWPNAAFQHEYPLHLVRITRPFYLGTYEVTKGQFRKFVEGTGYKTEAETDGKGGYGYTGDDRNPLKLSPKYSWKDWGVEESDEVPVVNVSWNDASVFCEWLSRKEKVVYRLPTEAEWEYACRAGTKTRYFFGDDPEGLVRVANVGDATLKARRSPAYPCLEASDGYDFPAPVGKFKPNGFGLFDMHGNVQEWCQDWYDTRYYGQSPTEDPPGAPNGLHRVCRGGAWRTWSAILSRSAHRSAYTPNDRSCFVGFRIAHSPGQ